MIADKWCKILPEELQSSSPACAFFVSPSPTESCNNLSMSADLSRQNIAQCMFPPWKEDEKASCCIFLVYYLRLCIHVDEHSIGTQID